MSTSQYQNDDNGGDDENLLQRIFNRRTTGIDPLTGKPLLRKRQSKATSLEELEDTVQYDLYFMDTGADCRVGEELKSRVMKHIEDNIPAFRDYIWHSEPFHLELVNGDGVDHDDDVGRRVHMRGVTHFGENIEDEWFIVFLLKHLTEHYDNLIVRVEDNDGQFLLIEAAMVIPDWIEPHNSDNRVFLHRGKVHIVPRPLTPSHIQRIPVGPIKDVNLSLRLIWESHEAGGIDTEAEYVVTEAIDQRLAIFPEGISTQHHTVRCYLPLPIALLLKRNRQLVAQPVRQFFERDPASMHDCSRMAKFDPGKCESVMTMVTFTKCLYAMIARQQFGAPKVFQCAWMLSGSADDDSSRSRHDMDAIELGVKLSSGFEMAYQASLREDGEFHGIVDHLLENIGSDELSDAVRFSRDEKLRPSDSDAWMVNSAHVEQIIKEKEKQMSTGDSQQKKEKRPDNGEQKQREYANKAKNIVEGLRGFVESISSFEGAEPSHGSQQHMDEFTTIMSKILSGETKGLDNFLQNAKTYEEYEKELANTSDDEDVDQYDDDDHMQYVQDPEMAEIMRAMDLELKTKMAHVSEQMETTTRQQRAERMKQVWEEDDDDDDEMTRLDELAGGSEEYEMIKNLLQSYQAQEGYAGPFSNIMHELGINLPNDDDDE